MTQTDATARPMAQRTGPKWFRGYRWRKIRESLLAYLFLLPAFIIIGTFGLFPMAFSVYVSLHRWRIIPGDYLGLEQYAKAIGGLAYVAGIWVPILLVALAVKNVIRIVREARENDEQPWVWLLPSAVTAAGVLQFVRFAVLLLPEVLAIAEQVKGQKRTQALFLRLLGEAWQVPTVASARLTAILILIAGIGLAFLVARFVQRSVRSATYYSGFLVTILFLVGAGALGWLTVTEIQNTTLEAATEGEPIRIWPQVIAFSIGILALLGVWQLAKRLGIGGRGRFLMIVGGTLAAAGLRVLINLGQTNLLEIVVILIGMALMFASWRVWNQAKDRTTTGGMLGFVLMAILMMIGAWVLVSELPQAVRSGYDKWWQGLQTTIYYSVFTVPVQLAIALFLAVLLFQEIKGRGLFRLIYFLPYITNPVAAASVFSVIFSSRVTAPINSLVRWLGGNPMLWLDEPQGLFEMLLPALTLPQWLAGPSLALMVIVIYNVWSYAGYNAIVFLAGLGGIPSSLYEAASIDGAGRWQQFRHITLPLLSPTTYFLTLIAVIGTFKAFNHVWVLRRRAALGTTDTASIVIFNEFNRNSRYGYASALALILMGLVLALTLINNRIAEEKVFYG
jgi:ABC-type sugar transport system permease subunit